MRLPFLWPALGMSLGVVSHRLLDLTSFRFFLLSAFIVSFMILWQCRGSRLFVPLYALAFFFAGCLGASLQSSRPPHAIEHFAKGQRMVLQGRVASFPEMKERGKKRNLSFVLEAENFLESKRQTTNTERLVQPVSGKVQVFLSQPEAIPQRGETVRLYGQLKLPRPQVNPGVFHYGRYLATQHIHALFVAYGAKSLTFLQRPPTFWGVRLLDHWRTKLRERIRVLFVGDHEPLYRALILGERKELSGQMRDAFMNTGTIHLLAISGLHLSLVCGSFYVLLLFLKMPQRMALFLTLLAMLTYVFLSGARIPVCRAAGMLGLGFLAVWVGRERNYLNAFFLAFLLFLIADANVLTQLSFQLSFLSVFSLMVLLREFREGWRWTELFWKTGAVMLGTFPLVLYHFQIFSPIALLSNLCAVPLVHFALLSAFLALAFGFVPGLGVTLAGMSKLFLAGAVGWIEWMASLPWGYYFIPKPTGEWLALYYGLGIAWVLLRSIRAKGTVFLRRGLGGGLLLCLFVFLRPAKAESFELVMFAAGKNELLYTQFPSQNAWLLNTGRGAPSNQARWILLPFLRSRGVKQLSGIVTLSAAHKHTGGLQVLRRSLQTDYWMYPRSASKKLEKKLQRQFKDKALRKEPVQAGEEWEVGAEGAFSVLAEINGRLLLGIRYQEDVFLILPQLDASILEALAKEAAWFQGKEIQALILPAFRTPPSQREVKELIELTQPAWILAPTPDALTQEIGVQAGVSFFDTGTYGALTLKVNEAGEWFLETFMHPENKEENRI